MEEERRMRMPMIWTKPKHMSDKTAQLEKDSTQMHYNRWLGIKSITQLCHEDIGAQCWGKIKLIEMRQEIVKTRKVVIGPSLATALS